MKRTIALAFALALSPALSAAPASAKPAPYQRQAYTIAHQTFVLQNGLTLIVHEDHSVPLVGVNIWYHVGSRNEKRGKTGFAHLFEHFFFNGSENYPHGFREAMDDLGANNRNGTTNNDRTNFFEDVPVSALERTLYLEADRMGFLGNYISKDMLERERGVVQNEKRQGENQPYGRVHLEKSAKMFPYSHPYSWPVIGSMEDLNAASLDDIREWYRTYYGPNNAVIALAGDITADQALALVRKYFESIPPGPPLARAEQWIPTLARNVRDEMQDQVPQVRIYRSWHVPGWRDADTTRLGLFTDVLANSKSARLNRRLIDEKRLATAVAAAVDMNELSGTFDIVVTVRPGVDPALAEQELDAVLREALDKGPTPAEVARVKASTLAGFARNLERLGGFVLLVDKPDAPQSTILFGRLTTREGNDPRQLAMDVVMQDFGGMATARLNRNLRLDKHWSYGSVARIPDVRHRRSLFVLAPVQTDKTAEAMTEVAKELHDIAGRRPIVGDEYDSIMRNMTSRLAGRFETLNALESAALQTVNLGLPDDYWARYAANLRALTPGQLDAAAKDYIVPDDGVWIVVGDLRKIEAPIRALGWGGPQVIDADGKPVR